MIGAVRFNPRTRRDRWLKNLAYRQYVFVGLAAASLLTRSISVAPEDPERPPHFIIEHALLSKLQTLAGGLHTEVVLCLRGTVHGDTARVTDFFMPEPRLSTSDRSSFYRCPEGTQAVWHNHPTTAPSASTDHWTGLTPRLWGEPISQPRDLCVLSKRDIDTGVRLAHPFIVVAVDAHTWCWWSLEQVRGFAEQPGSLGYPIPGQLQRRSEGDVTSDRRRPYEHPSGLR